MSLALAKPSDQTRSVFSHFQGLQSSYLRSQSPIGIEIGFEMDRFQRLLLDGQGNVGGVFRAAAERLQLDNGALDQHVRCVAESSIDAVAGEVKLVVLD